MSLAKLSIPGRSRLEVRILHYSLCAICECEMPGLYDFRRDVCEPCRLADGGNEQMYRAWKAGLIQLDWLCLPTEIGWHC